MSAPTLPGLAGAEEWPEVTVPGGAAAQLDEQPAAGEDQAAAAPTPARPPADPIGHRLPTHARRPPAGTGSEQTSPGQPTAFDVCKAQRCRMKIRWAKTEGGESIPIDYAPDPLGNLVWTMKSRGDWRLRELRPGETPNPSDKRWTSHFATCPESTRFRGRDRARRNRPPAAASPAPPALEVAPPAGPGVLLAVDGNSIAHRAFHAYEKSGMRDPDGRPLWAVYGFLALLVGIIDKTGPDAVVVGFDDREASARREKYPDYKAGRAERSEDLYAQLDQLPALLGELGVATMIPPALEADDVLASAAAVAEQAGWRCVVATSDKDAFGLITEAASVLRLVSGLDNAVTMTPATLLEQYGVTPAQWPDYTALVGDKSDNLPGVAGIGPKTAVKLLARLGDLDAALAASPAALIGAVGKAAAGKLAGDDAAAVIARNRDLMAPVRFLPVDPEACRPTTAGGTVAKVLKARHLPSLIDRTVAAVARATPLAGARLVPVASSTPAPAARPVVAPPVEDLAAGQDEKERTCPACGAVCAARVKLVDEQDDQGAAVTVLVVGAHPLGDLLMVGDAAGGWAVRRISGYVGDIRNRRRVHRCRTYVGMCVTPDHEGRPAKLYPGGLFCDGCAEHRAAVAAAERAGRQCPPESGNVT